MNIADLQAGLQAFEDTTNALSAQLDNLPADEAVLADAVEIAGLIDPALIPFGVLLPVAEFLVIWLIANNKLHQQRMLPPDARGSDPNLGAAHG